jgi:hypothetical protein
MIMKVFPALEVCIRIPRSMNFQTDGHLLTAEFLEVLLEFPVEARDCFRPLLPSFVFDSVPLHVRRRIRDRDSLSRH